MTLESSLCAVIGPLVADRIFPDVAPIDTPRPYVIYQQIGGQALHYVDDLIPDKGNAEVQIGVWGESRAAVSALSRQIDDALRLSTLFQAESVSALTAVHEPDLALYGAEQDFSIWHLR